jgi:hypothetical protein
MVFLVRKFFWVAVGAVVALELDRWMGRQRARLAPGHLTTTVLNKVNESLERRA